MADEKISAMPNAGAITGAELLPLVQGGANVKATLTTLKAFMVAGLTTGAAILFGNGAGGFSNVTIGSGLSFTGGTLSATGGGGGSPGGTGTNLQYRSGASTFGGMTGSSTAVQSVGSNFALGLGGITLAGVAILDMAGPVKQSRLQSVSGSLCAYNLRSVWDDAGSTPCELLIAPSGNSFTGIPFLIECAQNVSPFADVFTVDYLGNVVGATWTGSLSGGTGLPISTGVSGLAAGIATFLATPTSANLAAALTTKTGTGNAVFATTPTLVTPVLGVATGTSLALGGATIGTDAFATTGTTSVGTVNVTSATIPSNGMYLSSANTLTFSSAGAQRFFINGTSFAGQNANSINISNGNASVTAPTVMPNRGSMTNGWGGSTTALSGIIGSSSIVQILSTGFSVISGVLTLTGGTLLATSAALTNNAAAALATITNGPTAGNPTKWIPINDNGTTRNIPAW